MTVIRGLEGVKEGFRAPHIYKRIASRLRDVDAIVSHGTPPVLLKNKCSRLRPTFWEVTFARFVNEVELAYSLGISMQSW